MELTAEERDRRATFASTVDDWLMPIAADLERDAATPADVVKTLASHGWLGAVVAGSRGGLELDNVSYGLLCEQVGRASSSVRSLLTVQNMVAATLERWGTDAQRDRWLPRLARGDAIAAFCLTEPDTGSDAGSVGTLVDIDTGAETCSVTGTKLWVTFGQIADVFLVVGRTPEGAVTAVLVEATAAGVSRVPVDGMLGLRAAMLAEVRFDHAVVPVADIVARPGAGFTHVANTTLDHGRYSIAWGCAGSARACVDASLAYAAARHQFGKPIAEHQLVRRLLSDMLTEVRAARLLCLAAGRARDRRALSAVPETMMAKYYASQVMARAAGDAVQVHGAHGCSPSSPVERHFRDAKVMQIIEGSDQMQQLTICEYGLKGRL